MNRTELHPIEVAITIAVLTLEAALLLARVALVPVLALLLTLAQRRPASPAVAPAPPPATSPEAILAMPLQHPLALVADRLVELPVTQLRAMAGTRSKSIRKAALIAQVIACS